MNPLFEPDGERQDAIMSENEDEEAMMIDSEEEDVIMIDHKEPSGTCDETLMRNRDHLDAQPQVPSSNTLWVTPETVGLYCQVQDRGNCALHALNAMAGRAIITPNEAQALLRHPQVPRPADGERPDCNADGWFRWEAINKLLYYTTTITNYQLPNGPVKAGRRWGQRHPQGANLGSNGILKFLSKTDTMAATSPP